MSKLKIGRIPIMKGEWTEGTVYNKLWQVTDRGSTFQSKVNNNSTRPTTIGTDGKVVLIHKDLWLCIADGTPAKNAAADIAVVKQQWAEEKADIDQRQKALEESVDENIKVNNQVTQSNINANNQATEDAVKKAEQAAEQANEAQTNADKAATAATKSVEDINAAIAAGTGGAVGTATNVVFDNSDTGLEGQNVQSALSETAKKLKVDETEEGGTNVNDVLKIISNSEYMFAVIDADKNVLGGYKWSGEVYVAQGMPEACKVLFASLQKQITENKEFVDSAMRIVEDDNWLLAIIDEDNNVMLGLDRKGELYAPKGMPEDTKTALKELWAYVKAKDSSDDERMTKAETLADERHKALEEKLRVVEGQSFLAALIDAANNRLITVNENGDYVIAKDLFSDNGFSLRAMDTGTKALFAFVDKVGNLLAQIGDDGKLYAATGVTIGDWQSGIKVVETNSEWLFGILDANNNVLAAIDEKGGLFCNSLRGALKAEVVDNDEWLFVLEDCNGNIACGIKRDMTFYAPKVEVPGMAKEGEDAEFLYVILDAEKKVLGGIWWNGEWYMPKGIPEEQKKINKEVDKQLNTLAARIADFHGGTGDWSESGGCEIPIPRCAMLNLITTRMPTAKSGMGTSGVTCDIPCIAEFWDRQGNYFKIPILLSAQGNSSMAFAKKNLALDLFSDSKREESFNVKFGDWVKQNSFHLKAYYTDAFRGVGAVSYMLYEEMVKTRDLSDDRPYKKAFTSKYGMSDFGLSDSNANLDENFDTGAKCFPQGFPCIVLQNGDFYGIYSWQLKKHRDNMHQNKKTAEHIHLDGTLGAASIWGGTVDWTQFEVRNPKNLYMQEKQTIRGEETQEYNGDYPREIMGEDSEAYDSSDKNMKRCAKVKKYILALSGRIPELKQAVSDGKTDDEMRTLIAQYFMPSFMVDYILETNLVSDGDGYNKNWQWTTWDGTLWTANPYDHDGIFGAYHIGNWVSAPGGGWLGNSLDIPSGWIIKYYLPELKARWAELRKAGIFDAKHIAKLLWDWCDRIGYDNWDKEYNEKWTESPCNRPSLINADYWTRSTSYVSGWAAATTYAKGAKVKRNSKCWNSLVAGNVGNDPSTDDGTHWEDVTYDETKEYAANDVCYYGKSLMYGFKALQACTGQPPLTGFYNLYPRDLGHYDSVYRVENWLKQRITYMDKLLEYTAA